MVLTTSQTMRQRMAHSRMYLESIHLKVFKNDGWHWVSESSVGSVWVCVASRVAWALSGRVMRVSLCVPWPSWLDECGCLDKRASERPKQRFKVVTKKVTNVTTEVYLCETTAQVYCCLSMEEIHRCIHVSLS